jgi:hypothetical protein
MLDVICTSSQPAFPGGYRCVAAAAAVVVVVVVVVMFAVVIFVSQDHDESSQLVVWTWEVVCT